MKPRRTIMIKSIKLMFAVTIGITVGLQASSYIESRKNVSTVRPDIGFELLGVGKVAGACSVLHSLSKFAISHKSEKAQAFIQAFIISESVRLNTTVQGYIENCRAKDAKFVYYTRALEQMNKDL